MNINSSLQILTFFRKHPRFPFNEWNENYDDYTAMYLMLFNIIKSKISKSQINDWSYLKDYENYRLNGSEGLFYPFGCINHKRQQIILIGIAKASDENDDYANISISTEQEEFYWQVFKDLHTSLEKPFYYTTNIFFDPEFIELGGKIDEFLNVFFNSDVDLESLSQFDGAYFDGDFINWINN